MQKKLVALWLGVIIAAVWLMPQFAARADAFTNSFDSGQDYVANGVINQTLWDGVYLGFGDIPNGSQGGSGPGMTAVASEATPYPTFLNLQSSGGDWSGGDNDGFFLYKVVAGDFDVSVASLPFDLTGGLIYDNRGFNFAGLQVRAYNPDNSGAGYSTTDTNNPTAENSLRLWRFQQFNIDGQIRVSTNGGNQEFTYASNLNTNDPGLDRRYRITRVGNDISFYYKINDFDPWIPATNNPFGGTLTRDDWAGVALQVGIAQAPFSTATRDAVFDDFALSGTNVTFPTPPTAPSSLVSTGSDPTGSLTLSWTKGTPGNNSLVVMTAGKPIQHNPVNGLTYNASAGFGDPTALLGGDEQYVVYNGPGNSVTVTNLGANFVNYNVAVFEYSAALPPVYNTASPAINSFAGPGGVVSVEIVAPTTNIVAGGAVQLGLIAAFSTGEVNDEAGSPNASWSSDAPSVADVVVGTVSGLSPGTANITASIGGFNPSVAMTVDAFAGAADDFTTVHDYASDGLVGTPYNGLYLNFGDVPLSNNGGDGPGSTLFMDAQISDTNGLFISSVQSTWSGNGNDGPFLFQIVPGSLNGLSGDFSATLHIESMNVLNGVVAGLMARLYNPVDGGPLTGSGGEHNIAFWKVQNGDTSVRRTQTQPGFDTTTIANGSDVDFLLMTRVNSTNFYCFERADTNALWTLVASAVFEAAASDAPMQVGIAQQSTTGVNGLTTFDQFSLSADGVIGATAPPPGATDFTLALNLDLSMTLDWVAADGGGDPVQSIAVIREGAPVSSQPAAGADLTGNSVFGAGTDLGGGNYVVFVSDNPPASTNNSVNVTGLTPGLTYYAAIYTFTGTGTDKVFNTTVAPTVSLVDGVLIGIAPSVTGGDAGGIPNGGVGVVALNGIYTGGASTPLTDFTISSGDTNVIKVAGKVLTGIANGSAPVTVVAEGFTNVSDVAVRPPTFVDDFSVNRDYLTAGVTGSGYDGLYTPNGSTNPIPLSPYVPDEGSGAIVGDANVTSNGLLVVTASGSGWEGANVGPFFLFKYVPSDFQISTRIDSYQALAYSMPGLLARAYGFDTNSGEFGAPFGTAVTNEFGTNTLGEYWVSLCRFDEFNIGTYARRNIDSQVTQNTQTDQDPAVVDPDRIGTNYWLLIVRSQDTEFDFYKRSSPTDPWVQVPNKTHYSIPQFAGQPMQVGIMAEPFNGPAEYRNASFDSFMLDEASASLQIDYVGGDVLLTYPVFGGFGLESTVSLTPVAWQSTSGTPIATNGALVTVSIPATNATSFYRLVQ